MTRESPTDAMCSCSPSSTAVVPVVPACRESNTLDCDTFCCPFSCNTLASARRYALDSAAGQSTFTPMLSASVTSACSSSATRSRTTCEM